MNAVDDSLLRDCPVPEAMKTSMRDARHHYDVMCAELAKALKRTAAICAAESIACVYRTGALADITPLVTRCDNIGLLLNRLYTKMRFCEDNGESLREVSAYVCKQARFVRETMPKYVSNFLKNNPGQNRKRHS